MSIVQGMKARLDIAIRNQEKAVRTSLRTVLGEVQTRALRQQCDVNDAVAIKVLKDTISGNRDSLKYRHNPGLEQENELLASFLPDMMTDADIERVLLDAGVSSMPEAMKYLSANHPGMFDGKSAKAIALKHFN